MGLQNAIWVAGIFGPFLVITGLWMILYHENLIKIWNSIKATPGAFYIIGVFNLLLGLFILNEYNMWTWSKAVLVTILGWCLVLRGILSLFMPQVLIKAMTTNMAYFKVLGIIPFIWGVVLCWLAFS